MTSVLNYIGDGFCVVWFGLLAFSLSGVLYNMASRRIRQKRAFKEFWTADIERFFGESYECGWRLGYGILNKERRK